MKIGPFDIWPTTEGYSPRLDYGRVVVIIGASLDMVPSAIDVAAFADEID